MIHKIQAAIICVVIFAIGIESYRAEHAQPVDIAVKIETVKILPIKVEYVKLPTMPVDTVVSIDSIELDCMATNIFFEARNQKSDAALAAVGYTVLNRVANPKRYPNTVCGVIYDGYRGDDGKLIRNRCQFSWACDGTSGVPDLSNVLEQRAWDRATEVAEMVIKGEIANPIGNSTMYHATYVSPYWQTAYDRVAQVGTHIFYQAI